MGERLGAIPERAAADDRLTLRHLRVLVVVAARANRFGGWGWALNDVVAAKAGFTGAHGARDGRRILAALLEWGYLARRRALDPSAPKMANEYRVLYDATTPQGGGPDPLSPKDTGRGSPPPPSIDGRGPQTPVSIEDRRGSTTPPWGVREGFHDPSLGGQGGVVRPLQVVTTSSSSRKEEEEEEGGEGSTAPTLAVPRSPRTLDEQHAAILGALPAEDHTHLGAWLRSARYPASIVASIWPLLDPERQPHFAGAVVGQAIREMQASDRPAFNAPRLARWCANLAADVGARAAGTAAADPAGAVLPPLVVQAFAREAHHLRTLAQLTIRYGQKRAFVQAPETTAAEWRKDLARLTPDEIEAAVEQWAASDADRWPLASQLRTLGFALRSARGQERQRASAPTPDLVDEIPSGWHQLPSGDVEYLPTAEAAAAGYPAAERPALRVLVRRFTRAPGAP